MYGVRGDGRFVRGRTVAGAFWGFPARFRVDGAVTHSRSLKILKLRLEIFKTNSGFIGLRV